MDIHIEVPRVNYEKLSSDRLGESSADIRARVESARARQRLRFAEAVNVVSNSDMRVAEVRQFCKLDESSESLVRGLKGDRIPLVARIFAVADVIDDIINNHPYHNAQTRAKSLRYIREQSNRHFDPYVVDVF